MRRLVLFLLVMTLLGVSVPLAGAQSIAPVDMAQYFPADTEFFFAMRTDDGFIDELDAIVADVRAKIPAEFGVPPVSLSALLDQALAEEGTSRAELRTWLGDGLAFGMSGLETLADSDFTNDEEAVVTVALQINDAAAFEAFIMTLPDNELDQATRTEENGVIVYRSPEGESPQGVLAIGSDVVVFRVNSMDMPLALGATLDGNATFSQMTGALPAPSYNMIGYVDLQAFMAAAMESAEEADMEALLALGFDPANVGGFAFGATILDGRSFTIDLAQSNESQLFDVASLPVVSADFANLIPAGADLVIHGTNLSDITRGLLSAASQTTAEGEPDPMMQIEQGVNAIGLDLEDDILSWTTGDFALYLDVDVDTIIGAAMSGEMNFASLPMTSSLLIEATDTAAAERLASSLGNTLTALAANEDEITASEDTIGGSPVTVFSGTIPTDFMPLPIELVLGSNSDAFFFGTRDAAEFMASGGDSLSSDPDYTDAAQYFLPDPYMVLYTNDEGFAEITVVPLALLGPSIGRVFENIVDELESTAIESTTVYVQDEMGMILQGIEVYKDIFASSSITASASDGVTRTRMTMTIDR